MKFSEHGQFSIDVADQLLSVDATGPFNDVTLNKYHRAIEQAIDCLAHKPWQQIIVTHAVSVFTPEAEVILEKTMAYRKKRGLTASAVVLDNVQAKNLIIHQLTGCYQRVGIPHAFFDNLADARAWLAQPTSG